MCGDKENIPVLLSMYASLPCCEQKISPRPEATLGHLFTLHHITGGRRSVLLPSSGTTESRRNPSYLGYAESRLGRSQGQPS